MRTYDQLTEEQQAKAQELALTRLLECILEGMRFSDELNHDEFQASIDRAIAKADEMKTPWFAHEYIMEARYNPGEGHITEDDGLWPVAESLRGMAQCNAEDALYTEANEHVVAGVVAWQEGRVDTMTRFTNIQIGSAGAFHGHNGVSDFSANFPLFLIGEAWHRGCDLEDLADGFGAGLGTRGDWSGIRDSSPETVARMFERALNHLFPRPNEPHIDAIDRARGHGEEPGVDNRGAGQRAKGDWFSVPPEDGMEIIESLRDTHEEQATVDTCPTLALKVTVDGELAKELEAEEDTEVATWLAGEVTRAIENALNSDTWTEGLVLRYGAFHVTVTTEEAN